MLRRLLFALAAGTLAVLVGVMCFAIGSRMGFMEGYLVAAQTTHILDAHIVLTSLDASAKGDDETARGLLEHVIDTALISAWSRDRLGSEQPSFGPRQAYLKLDPQVARLARHRKAHPRNDSEEPSSLVAEVVARHTSARDPD